MVHLALYKGKICSLKEISQKEGISFDYLEKIISRLEKTGLVKSKKGSRGGYFLARPSRKIKIGEIIRAVEGNASLVKCTARAGNCPIMKKCLAKKFWDKLQKSLNAVLNSLTLADLIKK
jgi:Rrf2 family transcriptional regulator, iron-sulfur cluster assembly transcription factor